jgi:hypothetical protein
MRNEGEIQRKIEKVEQRNAYHHGPVLDRVIEEGFVKGLNDLLDGNVEKRRLQRFKDESNYDDDYNRKADLGYLLSMTWVQEKPHPFGGSYP